MKINLWVSQYDLPVTASKSRSMWRMSKLLLTMAALMIMNMTAFAFYQIRQPGDPGLEGARQAGMITDVNESQTVGEATITLKWMYADVNRIALEVVISGLDPALMEIDPANPEAKYLFPEIVLTDAAGYTFSYAGSSTMPDMETGTLTIPATFYSQALIEDSQSGEWQIVDNYFKTHFESLQEPVHFTVQVALSMISMDRSIPPAPEDILGMASFDVAIPVYDSITFAPMETQAVSGVSMTVEQVGITPSQVQIRVCYTLPDGGDWRPENAILVLDEQPVMLSGMGLAQLPTPEDTERCQDMTFNAYLETPPLVMRIENLMVSEPETVEFWEQVRDELANHDVEIEVTMSGGTYYELISLPEGMTDEQYGQLLFEIRDSLRPKAGGPWEFVIPLPAE